MRPYRNSLAHQRHAQPKAIAITASRVQTLRNGMVQLSVMGLLYALTLWLIHSLSHLL